MSNQLEFDALLDKSPEVGEAARRAMDILGGELVEAYAIFDRPRAAKLIDRVVDALKYEQGTPWWWKAYERKLDAMWQERDYVGVCNLCERALDYIVRSIPHPAE